MLTNPLFATALTTDDLRRKVSETHRQNLSGPRYFIRYNLVACRRFIGMQTAHWVIVTLTVLMTLQ
ncbi:hypothetical protein L9G15_09275 [Shewanella sp. A3A]|nr:hypothetical protein [Shewanella ferrihydritica]